MPGVPHVPQRPSPLPGDDVETGSAEQGLTGGASTRGAPTEGLVQAGARGAFWLGAAQIVGRLALLITTVILAHLLRPTEFGLVSLALVLLVYAEALADAGVAQALVYLPRTASSARAALICSLVAGAGLIVVGQLAAPLIASFFDEPDVEPLVRLLSFTLLGASVGAVPDSLLRRDLLFSRVAVAGVARALVSGVISVALAFAGYGAWALAWGTVAGAVTQVIALWLLVPKGNRPDLALWRTTRQDIRQVLGYGLPVSGSALLSRLLFDVDYLVVGRILGATALGYYTLAFRLPEMLIINVFFILSAVTFPIYSKVRENAGMLKQGYLLTVRVYSLYGLCAGVGLAITAPLLVPTVFGDQWDKSVAPLVALALYAACRAVGSGANEVYKATGRPGLSLKLSVVRLAVLVPSLIVAAQLWGLIGVAWAQVVTSAAFAVFMQSVAAWTLKLKARELGTAIAPALLIGAGVAIVGLPLAQLPLSAPVVLVIVVVAGAAVAVTLLRLLSPALLKQLLGLVRRRPVAA